MISAGYLPTDDRFTQIKRMLVAAMYNAKTVDLRKPSELRFLVSTSTFNDFGVGLEDQVPYVRQHRTLPETILFHGIRLMKADVGDHEALLVRAAGYACSI